MANIAIGGLVSGINTDSIIEGMMKIQQNQLDLMTAKKTASETKKTAYQSLQTQLLTLRTASMSLSGTSNNPFDAMTSRVSNENVMTATVGTRAGVGTYQLTVHSLATAETRASNAMASAESTITQGSLSIRGGSSVVNIEVNESNDTLNGLATSINSASQDLRASVIQDRDAGFRLVLTSVRTGTQNSIDVTSDLQESTSTATKFVMEMEHPVQAASDAVVSLGAGPGAITVSNSTNNVSNLIQGVTLNLQQAEPDKPVTLTIRQDTEKASKAVKDFVEAYNGFLDFLDELTKYDVEANVGGILQGDQSALSIRSQLQSAIHSVVPNLSSQVNRISSLGMSTSNTGRLVLNEGQLQSILQGNTSGVRSTDLRKLFSIEGTSSNSQVGFLFAGSKTDPTLSDFQIRITRAAEQARVESGSPLAEQIVIDAGNQTLNLSVDGIEQELSLAQGEYTREEFANLLQSAINNHTGMTGRSVLVGVNSEAKLTITSESYGTSSRLQIHGGSALTTMGLSGSEQAIGVNVVGEFIVNGVVERATSTGRTLTGASGNAKTDGLQVRVNLLVSEVVGERTESITLSRGVASRLNAGIDKILHADKGILMTLEKRFNQQIENSQSQIDMQNEIFERQKERLLARFQAMETAMQQMQSTASMLGSQLASLSRLN